MTSQFLIDSDMLSPLRQLLELMTRSLDTLEKECELKDLDIPDLHAPFHPSSETFRSDPVVAEAASIISTAALHLFAILAPPHVSLYHSLAAHRRAAAVRVCLESHVTEILREGGPEGVHITDIGSKNGQDPEKIGRFLRFLASHHIYREIRPNVFTNTRISSMLDTHKSSSEIMANPERKHDGTFGLTALASYGLDEGFKASAYAWETLADPNTAKSGDPNLSPFARAMGKEETFWQFLQRPEMEFRQHRFAIAMQGIQALQPPDACLSAFDWKSLPSNSVVVDVAGGVGTSAFPLARGYPELKIVIQDLPGVIGEARKIWSKNMPDVLESGHVVLEVHDFFKPQAQREVSVFFMKQILHDWSDEYCVKILKNLWEAASSGTKLILMETLIQFSCHDPSSDKDRLIPGAVPREAPAPLLANYGALNMGYDMDISMFMLFNAQERTVRHFDELLRSAGWQITLIRRIGEGIDSTFLQSIEAVPIDKCGGKRTDDLHRFK